MARYLVGALDEIPPGGRKLVQLAGREVGVFNVGGRFYALRNVCPHQGAPLCEGTVSGTNLPSAPGRYEWGRSGEILRCPWHRWEFDLLTGQALTDPAVRVKTYPIEVEGNAIYCHV